MLCRFGHERKSRHCDACKQTQNCPPKEKEERKKERKKNECSAEIIAEPSKTTLLSRVPRNLMNKRERKAEITRKTERKPGKNNPQPTKNAKCYRKRHKAVNADPSTPRKQKRKKEKQNRKRPVQPSPPEPTLGKLPPGHAPRTARQSQKTTLTIFQRPCNEKNEDTLWVCVF